MACVQYLSYPGGRRQRILPTIQPTGLTHRKPPPGLRTAVTVDAGTGGFTGRFISWGDETQVANDDFVRDMSAFEGGRLIFWVKTPINLEVGIRSGNVTPGDETSKVRLSQIDPDVADDTWRRVCIPLERFQGSPPRADLSQIKVFFVVASSAPSGGTGGVPETFRIDDVRWESTPCS